MEIIGKFNLNIYLFKDKNGYIDWDSNFFNNEVPRELIIMQMKALLNNLQNQYFNDFDRQHPQFFEVLGKSIRAYRESKARQLAGGTCTISLLLIARQN